MMRTKRWGLFFAAALLAVGCGADDGGGPGSLTIAQFAVGPGTVNSYFAGVYVSWEVTSADRVRLEACTGFSEEDTSGWCVGGAVAEVPLTDPFRLTDLVVTTIQTDTRFRIVAVRGAASVASDYEQANLDLRSLDIPQVIDFRAEPRLIFLGDAAQLYTRLRNAFFADGARARIQLYDVTTDPTRESRWELVATLEADEAGFIDDEREISPTASRLYMLKLEDYDADGDTRVERGAILAYGRVVISSAMPEVPRILAFGIEPTEVEQGQTVTMVWEVEIVTDLRLSPPAEGFDPEETSGTATFAPPFLGSGDTVVAPVVYTLTATNGEYQHIVSVPVLVTGAPAVNTFAAEPASIEEGESATLTWTTTRATGVAITADPGDPSLVGPFAVDGSAAVSPVVTTTYTLTATGATTTPATSTVTVTVEHPVVAGDLVVTEIMFDPAGVADDAGEWFEVRNVSARAVPVDGLTLSDGTHTHAVTATGLSIAAGDWFVFGVNANTTTNGGVTVDHQYAGLDLDNTAGTVSVSVGATVIDEADYAVAAPSEGFSLSLDPAHTTAAENDVAANWCAAAVADVYGADGNHGTPGAANGTCP
jgi:hypothetical protein